MDMKHINLVLLLNDMRYINAVFLRGVGIDKPLIASCGSSKNGKGERGALNFLPPLSPLPKKVEVTFHNPSDASTKTYLHTLGLKIQLITVISSPKLLERVLKR